MKIDRIMEMLHKITIGSATASDIALLFLWIREDCSKQSNKTDLILWDIGSYISHNDARNQGNSHRHLKKMIKKAVREAGTFNLQVGRPLYYKNDVIDAFAKKLASLSIPFDAQNLVMRADLITNSLMLEMRDTEFLFEDVKEVHSCKLVSIDGKIFFQMQIDKPDSMDHGMKIAFPLFA